MKIEPKRRGWKEGVLTEELRSLGGTHKKGAVVRYKKHRLREIKESWDCKKQVFVARTLRWEGKYEWHGKPPQKDEAEKALKQLRTLQGKIISEHE